MNEKGKVEFATWNLVDSVKLNEKLQREWIRYPKLIEDMGLDYLAMEEWTVVDLGCGPMTMLGLLDIKRGIAVDPLIDDYSNIVVRNHRFEYLESIDMVEDSSVNLVICSNALDHMLNPVEVISEVNRVLVAGGYFAVVCCKDNAMMNPSPAHELNIDYELFRDWVDVSLETVHELTYETDGYRHGWVDYKGKVGQPAWAWLGRKVGGYKNIVTKGVLDG